MLIKKEENKKIVKILISILILLFISLLFTNAGLKKNLTQTFKISLNQPVLFLSNNHHDNKFLDYGLKFFYAIENRIFNFKNYEKIKIDISFSELEKIKSDREKALKLQKLLNPQKANIIIHHNGKKYRGTARLKGDLEDHWINPKQWSLKIKLKKNKTIFSMNEFALTIHKVRHFPYNFLIYDIMKKYNVLSPRYKTLKVNFNGDDWGLMLLEEQFGDSFYAVNKIKEAPIFKMTNENDFAISIIANHAKGIFAEKNPIENYKDIIKWQGKLETDIYNENKILNKTNIPEKNTNQTLSSIFKTLQEVIVKKDKYGLEKIYKHIDIVSFARVSAITAIFGDNHSTNKYNSRYYLNPYNLKIIPILTDPDILPLDENFFIGHNHFYKSVFHLDEFQNEYFRTLYEIKNNFSQIETSAQEICKSYGKNCSNSFNLDLVKNNLNFLIANSKKLLKQNKILQSKKNLNTKNDYDLNPKKINFRAFNNGKIVIDNLTSENLSLSNLKYMQKKDCIKNCKDNQKNILINSKINPSTFNLLTSKEIIIDDFENKYNFLEIEYFDETEKTYLVTERIEDFSLNKENFFKENKRNLNKNIIKINNDYILNKGNYIIKNPIIIPSGHNLIINAGVNLKMAENTYIMIVNGNLKFEGDINNRIVIDSINKKKVWKGIYVNSDLKSKNNSIIKNVDILNFSYFDNEKIQLTGGINFFKGDVKILNTFIENSQAEDAINLVKTNFQISNLKINRAISDGVDVDFGNGVIENSDFSKILGDAIDFSGSLTKLKNLNISEVKDKGISAGEETKLSINNININYARIGIAAKDSSIVEGSKIEISNCGLFDFASYQKKSYFSGAYLKIEADTSCKTSLSQKGSELIINNKKINEQKFNIKNLYDGTL